MNDLDNHDKRIPYYELLLERDLDAIPKFFLPKGFHFEFYKNGDRDNWIEIEIEQKNSTHFSKVYAAHMILFINLVIGGFMRASFSEIQFSYSITKEIEEKIVFSSLGVGTPYFPTQPEEKRVGYDLKFDGKVVSLFIQYKVPDKYVRKNSRYWSEFNREYFKFDLYPADKSPQHNLLVNLSKRNRKYQVYYCAPAFIEYEKLSDFHQKNQVSLNSIFINCYGLKEINGKEHHDICFNINPKTCIMHSDRYNLDDYARYSYKDVIEGADCFNSISDFIGNFREDFHNADINRENISKALCEISDFLEAKGTHLLLLKYI